jgi:virulence factor Mce-like protein
MRRILYSAAILIIVGVFMFATLGASNSSSPTGTYKIELDNAFGLVSGSNFKVAGVSAGTIKSIDLDQKSLHALVTVDVTQQGFGQFHKNATCQSRPQSLIGEYFLECDPGSKPSPVIKPGSTIPVTHTQSTIPADFLTDIMRLPYRQRLTLIINELGAGVAGRTSDLQAAIKRAVPALTQTDNLLQLLGNDSQTLEDLTHNANTVITALANNSTQVQRFITEANNAATDTSTQDVNLQKTFQNLPGFLQQLKPDLRQLGAAADANDPVLANLNAAAPQLNRFLTDLPAFSRSALPALRSLGKASVTGKTAVIAARPTIADLNRAAVHTPELSQNLAIVLHDLDDRGRAVETDPRSPGGQGYTGLEALLQYAFNQVLALDYFGPFGHTLALDLNISPMCTPYATPQTIALDLKTYGPSYRKCYEFLGPNQPGVNETDPSDPSAPVPDPGGAPPGLAGPTTNAQKLTAADVERENASARATFKTANSSGSATTASASTATTPTIGATTTTASQPPATSGTPAAGTASPTTTTSGSPDTKPAPPVDLGKTVGQILGMLGIGKNAAHHSTTHQGTASSASSSSSSGGSTPPANQAQQLLNFLIDP